jgi:uncharacterized protein (TIGR02757 family)
MSDDQQAKLETLYRQYHRRAYIGSDPLAFVYRYQANDDREVVGLIAALLAYGNVKAIAGGIEAVLDRLGERPAQMLAGARPADLRRQFRNWRYRVTDGATMAGLLIAVRRVRREHGSLNALFREGLHDQAADVLPAATQFVQQLRGAAGHPLDHLLPDPARQSACKRLMLYLRWMVRRDAIDPGVWQGVHPRLLIAPVDTHLHRVGRDFGWTRRKQANLATAREITAALREHCPHDPLRYDFALTRPGILRQVVPGQSGDASSDT